MSNIQFYFQFFKKPRKNRRSSSTGDAKALAIAQRDKANALRNTFAFQVCLKMTCISKLIFVNFLFRIATTFTT